MRPIALPPNQIHSFYRGGEAIARFRGTDSTDDHAPEDWVGSTTTRFGAYGTGLSVLPGGRLLRDAIAAEPAAFLGPAHAARFGPDTELLVKLLDAGERLPVHFHPDRDFARRHFGSARGKTEAWLIVETRREPATVWLGFRDDVESDKLAGWVDRQDGATMLGALNELPVVQGDIIVVPAGFPHAIGEGILLVELQEPADFSVLLEWTGFQIDGRREGRLGLPLDVALEGVRRSAVRADELAALQLRTDAVPESRPGAQALLPEAARTFFRAERLRPSPTTPLEPALSILVVVDGDGRLDTEDGTTTLTRGETLLMPYAAGPAELSGSVDVIRCLPPDPDGGTA